MASFMRSALSHLTSVVEFADAKLLSIRTTVRQSLEKVGVPVFEMPIADSDAGT